MAIINGNDLENILNGTSEADWIYGYGDGDVLFGNGGNDYLVGGAGADYISGGTGRDTVSYTDSTSGVWVGIGGYGSGGTAEGDYIETDIEDIVGSDHDDLLLGSETQNSIWGGSGDDIILGYGGDDNLYGGDGNDELGGGSGWDDLYGGDGDDFLIGGDGLDDLYGGDGIDTVSYADSWEGVSISLYTGYGKYGTAGDWIYDVENIQGSSYADMLGGNDVRNTLTGLDGDDTLVGYGGDDVLVGGKGADALSGGADEDKVSYADSPAGVWVDLRGGHASGGDAQGDDFIYGDIENFAGSKYRDVVIGSNVSNQISTGDGIDSVFAGYGEDVVWGGNGDDGLAGEGSDDQLKGDLGNDTLSGGSGIDRLTGGDGNDTLTGGTESDYFIFGNESLGDVDTVKDFHRSEGDKFRLNGMDANTSLIGDQAFTFLGTAAFTGAAGQLHYTNNGFETVLTGDINGDKFADFTVKLTDAPGLILSDFYL